MNEVVKYANELNKMGFASLNPNEQNILFTIFTLMKDIEGSELDKDLDEILKLAQIDKRSNIEYVDDLLDKLKNLQAFVFRYKDDKTEQYIQETIFPRVAIDQKKNSLKVTINPAFKQMYLAVYKNFTLYQLAEFAEIPSTYAKTIYRCLKQFHDTGVWSIGWKEFNELLEIPKSYRARDIDKQILKPTIKYLSEPGLFDPERIPFKGLNFEKVKDGKKIDRIVFAFQRKEQNRSLTENFILKLQQENQSRLDFLKAEVKRADDFFRNTWLKYNPPKDGKEPQRYGIIQKIFLDEGEKITYEVAIYYKKPALINSNFVEIIHSTFNNLDEIVGFIKTKKC